MGDNLPPLPEPARWLNADGCLADKPKASDQAAFSILQMRAYAEEAVKQEREKCIAAIKDVPIDHAFVNTIEACAAAIRARSSQVEQG